jgi:cytochrome b subunit of formate dehydrogenase
LIHTLLRASGLSLVLCLCAAGLSVCVAAQEGDEACLACHTQKQPRADAKLLQDSAHGKLECGECHPGREKHPHPSEPKKVNCKTCHADAAKAFSKSIHFELAKKGAPDMPDCASCHGTHNIFKRTDVRSLVGHFQVDETCLKCHTDQVIKSRHADMPNPEVILQYRQSIHGRGVHVKGLLVSATCTDCHGSHTIRPKSDPTSTVNRSNVPNTCKQCHLGIFSDFERSVHGQLWKAGDARGPVCSICHKAHDIKDAKTSGFRLAISDQCGRCHEDKARTYRDTFHGKATSLGYVVAAKCSDCHTAHYNLPKDNPQSTVHKDNLVATCGTCHPDSSANFVQYDPHLNSESKKDSALTFYVSEFMKWLLIGTFSFFGIHTLLWLQRSIVAVARKEVPVLPDDEKYVRRFSKGDVALHVIVVITFLTLVLTGIPLKYHYTNWAKALGGFLGGVEVCRFIHRLCALATISYFLLHVGWLAREVVWRRRLDLLGGPNSMIPRPQDLKDLFNNLRWFLYAGPRPHFDRWTYFEKFDYFAVFWGVPVIGLSGLLMWFPGIFSKFLPGVFFNIASIVHAEEALLAAGFIFVFHFYHNHMRLENFPIDTSIFTGRLALSRFKEERALEYARLSRDNRLHELLLEPPTAAERRKSKLFGYTALAIGLVLVIAVVSSYFLMAGHVPAANTQNGGATAANMAKAEDPQGAAPEAERPAEHR